MASRIALNSLRASASRARPHAALPQILSARTMASSSNQPPPAERAAEIVDKLPSHPNLITKTGTAILGSWLARHRHLPGATVIAVGYIILFGYIAKTVRLPYKEWAENHIARIKGVLDGARAEHTQAVQDRIDAVGQMKDVVSLTEGLFALSKETAQLESDAFVQRQRVALAAEVKTVLDSWVRFEQQEKENEQSRLVKTVVDSVLKSISEEKTQKDVLAWAVSEVELLVKNKAV
ncbi:ATP synthase [Lactarius vividus]|nr:ATP synthase [Lactarius vividus]